MMIWSQVGLQDAMSPVMSQLTAFHDHAMLVLVMVMTFVFYATTSLVMNKFKCRNIYEAQAIETVWTVLPAGFLLFLALPSLRLLYLMDEVNTPSLTIKTVAHQWYWTYEYSDFLSLEFDSYMTPEDGLKSGEHRLLEVDNRIVLPVDSQVRMLITSADVIHSWAIPSLGVKVDAIPGRLNQIGFTTPSPGVLYGQCSEICGANHSFMPIALEITSLESWANWVKHSTS